MAAEPRGTVIAWATSNAGLVTCGTNSGFPMDSVLLVAIMSVVALHVAALVGGGLGWGLGWGIMRLLGRGPARVSAAEGRDSIH